MKSDTYDALDKQLLNALMIDGRASFSTLADALGVSDQTIARRYRQLRASGVRVLARLTPRMFGDTIWFVRLRCTPDAAVSIATALAKRPDTSYIKLVSGGTEINVIVHAPDDDERDSLLLRKLPRTPRIVSMTAHSLIHTFYGGPQTWNGTPDALSTDQILALSPPPVHEVDDVALDADDRRLLGELQRDGRTSYRDLAAATGMSETSARRRVEHLRQCGAMYFDVEFDPTPIGYHATAMLWLTVSPSALATVGKVVGEHPEIAFAAATTGPANLCAVAICRNSAHLYRYISETLGSLEDVRHIETAPVMRTIKQLTYD